MIFDIPQTIKLIDTFLDNLKSTPSIENINCIDANGEILAEDVYATHDLPKFNNSALDGYAFCYDDFEKNNSIKIVDLILAGDKITQITNSQAVKIMTGAIIPAGADTVIGIEDAIEKDGFLKIINPVRKDNAIRKAGEDVSKKSLILKFKEIINPAKIMLLSSQGINTIKVIKKPNIAVLSTGNELIEPGESINGSSVYNANSNAIVSMIKNSGFNAKYFGILKDKDNTNKIRDILQTNDIIITTGGASVGVADFMSDNIKKLGFKPIFEKINVKPGKPTKIYYNNNKFIIVLPGNPMAAYLMFFIIGLTFIKKLYLHSAGYDFKADLFDSVNLKSLKDINIKKGRSNIIFGNIEPKYFNPLPQSKSSAMISPIVSSNAIYISNQEKDLICKDEILKVIKLP